MYRTVALLAPPYASLTYAVPEWLADFPWETGLRVAVPLGKAMVRAGLVLGASTALPVLPDLPDLADAAAIRPMLWPLERTPLLPPEHVDMVQQLSVRQAVSVGHILASVLPAGLRTTQVRLRTEAALAARLLGNDAARASSQKVSAKGEAGKARLWTLREVGALDSAALQMLGAAWMRQEVLLLAPRDDAAASEWYTVQSDPPWAVRPTATRQLALLEWLFERGTASRRDILSQFGTEASSVLDVLIKHELVAQARMEAMPEHGGAGESKLPEPCEQAEPVASEESALLPPPVRPVLLSEAQESALARLTAVLDAGTPATHLLFGVTGSGKTMVYLELIRACLQRGRSVLLLAPEVALALKLRRDVEAMFPDVPQYCFHGYQTPQRREATFRELAARQEPCVVVGTRSSLFLPLPRLGAIILDEEHDASFKQDEGLLYQAKEVAWFRARQTGSLLLLGSATPDLKTFYAASEAKIPMSVLPDRVGGGSLPSIRLVSFDARQAEGSLLMPESMEALRQTLHAGEQAVILLNRRGYAPLMYCLDCQKVIRCPHCDIALTYHKGRERLLCHYCGYSLPFPSPCPSCKGMQYHPMGQGTERIEEEIRSVLPAGGKVLRLDRDTTRRAGSMEAILEAFARQEAQVLVGTQMLSKGHHFPQVTLAVIADGDLGLNLPDYRAAERTFQLLVQSAGRAGRGERAGQVLIQTRDTHHYCWQFIQQGDYEGFYAHEISLRQKRCYPPFVNLALLRASYPMDWAGGEAWLTRFAATLRASTQACQVTLLGPAPAPLALVRGRKRIQCLLKAGDWQRIRKVYAETVAAVAVSQVRLSLDIDPVNML